MLSNTNNNIESLKTDIIANIYNNDLTQEEIITNKQITKDAKSLALGLELLLEEWITREDILKKIVGETDWSFIIEIVNKIRENKVLDEWTIN